MSVFCREEGELEVNIEPSVERSWYDVLTSRKKKELGRQTR